jgi:hypothetical protein
MSTVRLICYAVAIVALGAAIALLTWAGSARPVLAYAEAATPPLDAPCQTLARVSADAELWLAVNGAGGMLVVPGPGGSVDIIVMAVELGTSLHFRFRNDCLVEAWERPLPG